MSRASSAAIGSRAHGPPRGSGGRGELGGARGGRALTHAQARGGCAALVVANARYWTSVAPLLRAELSRWESRARAIPDPLLRALATGKLGEERFNIEVAATLATLAPRARRGLVVEAVVALQAAYDYLDVLTERPAAEALSADPVEGGRRLQRALIDAVTSSSRTAEGSRCGSERDYYRGLSHTRDGGYLRQLVTTVSGALAQLPAADTVAEIARGSAERCAQAQVLAHACAHSGEEELERWARGQAAGSGLRWPEWLVGAQSSVLALHALIAAAADDHTTREDAERIDRVYLSIGALTLLDSLVDRERDLAAGERCYMHR